MPPVRAAFWRRSRAGGRRCARRPPRRRVPFSGGWLVYLAYEVAAEIEPRLALPRSADSTAALAIRAPAAWIRDRQSGAGWLVAEPGYEALLERFARDVRSLGTGLSPDPEPSVRYRGGRRRTIRDGGRRALEFIAAGDVYQANLSRRWQGRRARRARSGGAVSAPASRQSEPLRGAPAGRDFAVISSSPERLVSVQGDRVDPPDCRHPPARRIARAGCRAHRVPARQREGARGARHADRSGAQRSRAGLRRGLGAGR